MSVVIYVIVATKLLTYTELHAPNLGPAQHHRELWEWWFDRECYY